MPGLQEYVIRLSADVDNTGVSKIMSLLDMNKMKALGLTAALTAATTAVYKFIESATKKEIELDNLAKKQKKSIEDTRAQKEALDQMGMSLNDIKKDAALKSIYDDLVKFNKEMEMPNASGAIAKVRLLQGAFWKLKSAVSYVVQRVGLQMLENLEQPMDRFTSKLNKISDWIRDNFTSITTKISKAMTGFSKGIITIVEGVEKVIEFINKIPDGVKGVAAAIAALFAIIKSGPIGWLLAAVTAIGDIVHDFENYQYNKENGFKKGDEGYVENLNDLIGIWDAVDDANKSGLEKVSTVGTLILQAFADGLKNIPAEELGTEVGNFVNDIFTKITEAMTGTGDGNNMISALTDVAKTVVTGIMGFISAAFQTIDLNTVKDAVGSIIDKVFNLLTDGLSSASDLIDTITANADPEAGTGFILSFVEGIVTSISKGFDKLTSAEVMGDVNNIIQKVFGLLTSAIQAALKLVAGGENKQTGEFEKGLVQYGADLIKGIFGFISEGLKGLTEGGTLTEAANLVQDIFGAITGAISNTLQTIIGGKNEKTGEYEKGLIQYGADFVRNILKFIGEGAKTLETSDIGTEIGTFVNEIFSKLGDFLAQGTSDITKVIPDAAKTILSLGKGVATLIGNAFTSIDIDTVKTFAESLWKTIGDAISNLSGRLGSEAADGIDVSGDFDTIGTKIGEAIGSAIKIGVTFIANFIKEAVSWIASHPGELLKIGQAIVEGIMAAFHGLFDGLMSALLGDKWDEIKKGAETKEELQTDVFTDKETGEEKQTVTGKSGREWSLVEATDTIERGGTDVIREEFGMQRISDYNRYQKDFWNSFGIVGVGDIRTNTEGLTFGSNETLLPSQMVLKALGVSHNNILGGGTVINTPYGQISTSELEPDSSGKSYEDYMRMISTADSAETMNTGVQGLIGLLGENGIEMSLNGVAMSAEEMAEVMQQKADEIAKIELEEEEKNKPQGTEEETFGGETTEEETAKAPEFNPADFIPEDYNGNVDLLSRKEIPTADLTNAGWTDEDGGPVKGDYATVFSQTYSMGDKSKGYDFASKENQVVTFTPIQADGTVVSPALLDKYVEKLAEQSEKTGKSVKELDASGIKIDGSLLQGLLLHSSSVGSGESLNAAYNREGNWAVNLHDLQAKLSEAKVSVKVPVQTTGESAAAAEGANKMQSAANGHTILYPTGTKGDGDNPTNEAMGGRFDKPFNARVAEAGPEYIIPITKGAQAVWLATQMLREMGKEAFQQISSALGYGSEEREESRSFGSAVHDLASGLSRKAGKDFSLGTAGTIGGSLGGIENALQNMQQNFTYNISAPVSIQVQSSGASAEEIGTKAYDLAERHLLKTLRGAYA